jgi:hypothetical protein
MSDIDELIRESVEIAEYGLGRDGCPFCGAITIHNEGCIAARFGARSYVGDEHPESQGPRPARPPSTSAATLPPSHPESKG